jgi:hypothetical protein
MGKMGISGASKFWAEGLGGIDVDIEKVKRSWRFSGFGFFVMPCHIS